jgi:hypothetical protein
MCGWCRDGPSSSRRGQSLDYIRAQGESMTANPQFQNAGVVEKTAAQTKDNLERMGASVGGTSDLVIVADGPAEARFVGVRYHLLERRNVSTRSSARPTNLAHPSPSTADTPRQTARRRRSSSGAPARPSPA